MLPALGDGAMGTMLHAAGLDPREPPERWLDLCPDRVLAVHTAWRDAGAGWLRTNTFGASAPRLRQAGLGGRTRELNRLAAQLACRVAGMLPVLGSLGPADGEAGEAGFVEQAEALAEGGVRGFVVETILNREEGLAAVRACVAAGVGPVIASFTPRGDGRLHDGTPAEMAAAAWIQAGAYAVGVNCGTGPESMVEPVSRLVGLGLSPVYAAPSAGLPDAAGRHLVSADAYARAAIKLRELGVAILAGCCGTTPDHLRAVRRALAEDSS